MRQLGGDGVCGGRRAPWPALLALGALLACIQEPARVRPRTFRATVEAMGPWQEGAAPDRGAAWATGPRRLDAAASPEDSARQEMVVQEELLLPEPGGPTSFDWNLIRNPDGTVTKAYLFRTDRPGATVIVDLLRRFIPGFAALRENEDYLVEKSYLKDPRKENEEVWKDGRLGAFGLPYGTGDVADLLLVTASEDLLRQVDAFLDNILADAPQIEIEVTIVEIFLTDALSVGVQATFTRLNEEEFVDDVVVNLAQDLVQGTFGSFSAIHDDTAVNGLIEFLQSTTDSNVLSSPKLAVLNGHRAVIDTGAETPFFTPTFTASGVASITTDFKPTGIKVVVSPFLMSPELVQLEISVEVSSVTGFVTAGIGNDAVVENPLIARRDAHTVVQVPSGKTALIGGLIISDDREVEEKIPFLGDIPWLGYLFRSTTSTRERAQVLFLVKPRVLGGGEDFGPSLEDLEGPAHDGP